MQHEMHLPINHHRVLRPNHLLSLGISKKELCLEFQMQDKVLSLLFKYVMEYMMPEIPLNL